MPSQALTRRLITIPVLFVSFVVVTALLPIALLVALAIDLIEWARSRRPFIALRCLSFIWLYALGEVWAVIALGLVLLTGRQRSTQLTYSLQRAWARWNFVAVRTVFQLEFDVEGTDSATPGPFLLLSRHASLIDTLIPAEFVVRPFELRLRYVLKSELLVDPALDIAGNRLPNCFIDRGAGESEADLADIKGLASGLFPDEGILIYPEGTRYSDAKKDRYSRRFADRKGRVAEIARGLKGVLPPRPGGTLALLEASAADVVVLAHRGLEGFARVADIWAGDLVGSRVTARLWRIGRDEIPEDRARRVEWLYEVWAEVDRWVMGGEPA